MSARPCNHASSGCDYPAGECWEAYAAPATTQQARACRPVGWTTREQVRYLREDCHDATIYWRPVDHTADREEIPLYTHPDPLLAEALEALERCRFDSLNMSLEDMRFCTAVLAKVRAAKGAQP